MGEAAIVATGIYVLNYCEWKSRNILSQTWTNFKTHFTTAYARVQEYQCTTGQANFNGANNLATDIDSHINVTKEKLQKKSCQHCS